MPDFTNLNIAGLAASNFVGTTAFEGANRPIFIDVGSSGVTADIARNGARLPNVALNPDRIADLIDVTNRRTLKVLRQSVEAGRAVERGATVDLVLTQTGKINVGAVDGGHVAFADLTFDSLFASVRDNPATFNVLTAATDATELTAANRATIASFAEAQTGTAIDPTNDAQIGAVFNSLQAARLYGG